MIARTQAGREARPRASAITPGLVLEGKTMNTIKVEKSEDGEGFSVLQVRLDPGAGVDVMMGTDGCVFIQRWSTGAIRIHVCKGGETVALVETDKIEQKEATA